MKSQEELGKVYIYILNVFLSTRKQENRKTENLTSDPTSLQK